jgi:hypothetical protein
MMYGDLHGDLFAAEGRNGLLEYNRNVTGLRFQLQGPNPTNWIQGQVARPKTAYKRDITTALVGSAFRLSESQIVRGSETITLEVRDRRNPERIISRENLVRNVDYWLDPQSGVLFMMRPFTIFDSSLNIVQLVSTYEFQATAIHSATFLGRGSYSFSSVGLRLGASALSQSEGGDNFSVAGLELEQKLFNGGHFKAELPVSNGRLQMDPNSPPQPSEKPHCRTERQFAPNLTNRWECEVPFCAAVLQRRIRDSSILMVRSRLQVRNREGSPWRRGEFSPARSAWVSSRK